jgi:CheY-like chemotaxis protein
MIAVPMAGFNYRILAVDDDPSVLQTAVLILENKGYEVRAAQDGFAALTELRRSVPDVIISDLGMPNMSGFELLSVVRRRFPHVPVIAISGKYEGSPNGVIADAFFSKAQYTPEQLFAKIVELLEQSPLRPHLSKPDSAPVWIPRNDAGYFVVTCPECLRSFSLPDDHSGNELHETTCFFCDAPVRYLADLQAIRKKAKRT